MTCLKVCQTSADDMADFLCMLNCWPDRWINKNIEKPQKGREIERETVMLTSSCSITMMLVCHKTCITKVVWSKVAGVEVRAFC